MCRTVTNGVVRNRGAKTEKNRVETLVGQLDFPICVVEAQNQTAVVDRQSTSLDINGAIT